MNVSIISDYKINTNNMTKDVANGTKTEKKRPQFIDRSSECPGGDERFIAYTQLFVGMMVTSVFCV